MIVWLASYPRSGNTLMRMLLQQAFGLTTYSVYDDPSDIGADPALSEVVGHVSHGRGADFVTWARSEPGMVIAKTHELAPAEPEKAIYLVRDGRASVVSYWHYRRQIAQDDAPLIDIVRGDVWGGGWSDHVNNWLNRDGPQLLLRFEEVTARPDEAVERVGRFLGLDAPQRTNVNFEALHDQFPHFFRSGANERNLKELDGDALDEFWSLHGSTMQRLGY